MFGLWDAGGPPRPTSATRTVVVDHFHAVALANKAVDDVRRRVQRDTRAHRGRTGDPLSGIRRLLLVAGERLTDRGRERMLAGLAAGDPEGEVGAAVLAKELLRDVYAAADVPELTRLATTIPASQDEVLAYHTTGLPNGPTEAVNLPIEKVRRIGHGFRNFDNYRLLLRCGVTWQTQRTARIRGRQPPLIA